MKQSHDSSGLTGRQLKRLLHQLCERAQDDVLRISSQEETATHQLRVRMKKMQALLRLAREGIEEHTLQAMRLHIRTVKNACACNRDRVVQHKLIDKLAHRFHLAPKNRPHLVGMPQAKPPASSLRHQLHALGQLIDNTCIESLSAEQLLGEHARCYRKGRRLMKQACETTDNRILHRWRHRVKDLYFQTLALPQLPGSARRIKRAKRLGHLLGRDQDLANLAREPAFSMRRSPWMQVINEHRGCLRERFLVLGHKLYAPHSSRFSGRIMSRA
ncbi:CHAD domain-containing protein [Prosthecobacter sp.]|uniref:CHAD domain-containing protein n=1 Tax=Prosthecobacter sp. TaxID=1965333 RepID=UPI002ABB9F15|nr:CHAD domain-containing protein [Prosthecobacter sp.]MDZ4405772.1 CHAD domain-containing protein [Prosthecobacter sp.]